MLAIDFADNGDLQCRLDTYPRVRSPKYDTVSYWWGNDKETVSIICNGFEIQIRRTLLILLKALKYRRNPSRYLWIDAICLNQADNDEKAVQVPLMAKIYKRASSIIMWLGPPAVDLERALIFLVEGARAWIESNVDCDEEQKSVALQVLQDSGEMKVLCAFLSRPWFRRLWCLQEVLLSNDLYFLCHTPRIPFLSWKKVHDSVKYLQSHIGFLVQSSTEDRDQRSILKISEGVSYTIAFMEHYRTWMKISQDIGAANILFFVNNRQCSEPVDRVWGMLGLLAHQLVDQIRAKGIIDYSEDGKKEYWKAYEKFLIAVYEYDAAEFWTIVLTDIGRERHSLLPSWCPDFNRPTRYWAIDRAGEFRAGFVDSKDRSKIESTLSPSGCLSVSGFQVDKVVKITSVCRWIDPKTDEEGEELLRQTKVFLSECRALRGTRNDDMEGMKSLCCTLLAANENKSEGTSSLRSWPRAHQALEDALSQTVGDDLDTVTSLNGKRNEEYCNRLWQVSNGRKLFTTLHGRIGLGPLDLQADDAICAINGAEALCVLRVAEGFSEWLSGRVRPPRSLSMKYKLIGDAYVYGLMHGQAFTVHGTGPKQHFEVI